MIPRRAALGKWLSKSWLHLVLPPLALLWLGPLVWILLTSLKTRTEVFDPDAGFLPSILIGQLVTITLAAYAFARLEFPFKRVLFTLFLLQVMFPIYAIFLTNFITLRELDLINTLPAMIVPFVASGYGTFMLRQSFRQVPSELSDAARLDGCGHLGILWHVYLPLVQPTLVAFGIISVVTHWNDYMWPLLVTNSDEVRTLPIGLGLLAKSDSGADWTRLMAGTTIVVSPLLLAFVIFQRRFIDSFMHTGVK
jgi:sn-glycerol 3-phosphate transport system permease protein